MCVCACVVLCCVSHSSKYNTEGLTPDRPRNALAICCYVVFVPFPGIEFRRDAPHVLPTPLRVMPPPFCRSGDTTFVGLGRPGDDGHHLSVMPLAPTTPTPSAVITGPSTATSIYLSGPAETRQVPPRPASQPPTLGSANMSAYLAYPHRSANPQNVAGRRECLDAHGPPT